MEAVARERVVFSADAARLAVCGLQGEVKVWASASGSLASRFSPGGARGAAAAAASWSRCVKHKHRKSGKKLALAVGSKVVVWNETKGRQEAELSGVHTGPITDLAWGPANLCLYSASEDKHVAVWNVATWDCSHKWQADKHGVKCICCHGDSDLVATAGRSIKLWRSTDYSLVKKFTGHAMSVSSLVFIGESLLLSCAHGDRILNLWSAESRGSAAVASFLCEDEVASCYVTVSGETVHAAALTQEAVVHLFKYPLTNQIAAPISAHSTIQFATAASESDSPAPLPVLAVCLTSDGITVAHSSSLRPHIETLVWSECEGGKMVLVRERVAGLLLPGQGDKKTRRKRRDRAVTVLGPGHMTVPDGSAHQRKQTDEAPLSSLLPAEATAAQPVEQKSRVATADSLSRLLGQAVRSGDHALLEEALRVRKEIIIRQTIRRLPLPLVLPLLQQLIRLLETSPSRGLELSLWVRQLLTLHSSYLMTQPKLVPTLSSVYQVLESRSSVYSKLCRVHGKLDLMNIHESEEASRGGPTEAAVSLTVGEEAAAAGRDDFDSEQSGDDLSDLSEGEADSDQSDAGSEVSMDTAEQRELT